MAAATLNEQELRADFTRHLVRRFETMRASEKCLCGAPGEEHRVTCPKAHWATAARMTELIRDELDGEADG